MHKVHDYDLEKLAETYGTSAIAVTLVKESPEILGREIPQPNHLTDVCEFGKANLACHVSIASADKEGCQFPLCSAGAKSSSVHL